MPTSFSDLPPSQKAPRIQNSYVGIAAAYILFQTELVGKQVTTEDDGGSRCGRSSVPIVKYI